MRQQTPILTLPEGKSQGPALPGFEHLAAARRERKQAEAQAIEDARAFLDTAAAARRSPQSVFHFDRADQVVSLVTAREATPDIGFMARLLALCSLPRTNPGKRLQYTRVNGPYTLTMSCTARTRLPFGILPRLLLAWVCSEAVRTQSRVLTLGPSLSAFMRKLGIGNDSGGVRGVLTRLRHQMNRFFSASIVLEYDGPGESMRVGSLVTDRMHLWWNERRPDMPVLWESTIRLGEDVFADVGCGAAGTRAVTAGVYPRASQRPAAGRRVEPVISAAACGAVRAWTFWPMRITVPVCHRRRGTWLVGLGTCGGLVSGGGLS